MGINCQLNDLVLRTEGRNPEEYGVFLYGIERVAHLRMASGIFIAEVPDKCGKRIYAEEPGGDTTLTLKDRPLYQERMLKAVWRYLKYGEAWV